MLHLSGLGLHEDLAVKLKTGFKLLKKRETGPKPDESFG